MNTQKLTPKERFDLVMECRSSGLSDQQWCLEHGISRTTLYNWISRFRENGFPNVLELQRKHNGCNSAKQEVVKLQIVPEPEMQPSCSDEELTFKQLNQVAPIMDSFTTTFAPVAEICCNDVIIRISNEISLEVANILLSYVGGAL